MRRSGRHLVVAVVAALAVAAVGALTGCVPGKPAVTPAPTSTSGSPVFASDEEALAAAEEAYRAYTRISDQILNEGGVGPERILDVASGEFGEQESVGLAEFASNGWKSTGSSDVTNFVAQSVNLDGSPVVIAYVCVDVSAVNVVDSTGISVVSATRPDTQAFEVTFDGATSLLPIAREVWSGGGVC